MKKKKKSSDNYQTIRSKISEYYKEFDAINCDLKKITDHKALIIDQSEGNKWIPNDFKIFQEHILCIIETMNKLEENHGLRMFEFDVRKIWPVKSIKKSHLLKNAVKLTYF